jgi:hypothetical protein
MDIHKTKRWHGVREFLRERNLIIAVSVLTALAADAKAASPPAADAQVASSAARMAKVLPTPRLYEMSRTTDGKADSGAQFCVGADPILKLLDSFRARADDPKPLSKGCTHRVERQPDGAVHMEMTCDKAAGAATTSHLVMDADSQMKELRQHMEMELDVFQPPRKVVSDTRMAQVGACPADLKPGEMRMPDGQKVDVLGLTASALSGPPRDDKGKAETRP